MVGSCCRWWNCTSITQKKETERRAAAATITQNKETERRAAAATASYDVISSHDYDYQLPDDIIAEILSRFPIQHVMSKFRYVCKQWFAVTCTQSFAELHYKNQLQLTPTFVYQTLDQPDQELNINLLKDKLQPTSACYEITLCQRKMKMPITQFYKPTLFSSYKGFLLFKHISPAELVLIILNPTTGEQVTVTAPASRYLYCGFYFHSSTEEYRVLFGILDDDDKEDGTGIGFAILGLRSRSLRRIKSFSNYCPSSSTPPILFNGALHWMVSESLSHNGGHQVFGGSLPNPSCSESILSFGTESEEFHVMPHPGKKCVGGQSHANLQMRLMEMDGQLCLCVRRPISNHLKLEIWVLEDYKEWIWVKRHVVMLGWWALFPDPYFEPKRQTIHALFIDRGELILDVKSYNHPSHFVYNLKNGSLRRLETYNFKGDMVVVHPSLFSLHTKRFGYVLSLNEVDDQVSEWDLDHDCRKLQKRK